MKATIKTNKGDINIDLYSEGAKLTVSNFANLSKKMILHYWMGLFMIKQSSKTEI